MNDTLHVYGVDPGIVHTGVVRMTFTPSRQAISIGATAIVGSKVQDVVDVIDHTQRKKHIFIEGYRPRSHYGHDDKMVTVVSNLHAALKGSVVLNNTGVKKVIRKPLMMLLDVWAFDVKTHHQDLRAAARIGLLGMVKDEELNALLAEVVSDHVAGRTWDVLS